MDALTVLRREHTRIAQLFAEFDALAGCACFGRAALMRELDERIRRHIEMEEALIYRDGEEEHQLVLHLLGEIAGSECHTPMYVPRVHALRDVLLHHIQEEETRIFPAHFRTAQVA